MASGEVDLERLAALLSGAPFPSKRSIDKVRTILAAISETHAIVPREATEAMVDRFVSRALCVTIHGDGGWSNYAREQYRTMIRAYEDQPGAAGGGE